MRNIAQFFAVLAILFGIALVLGLPVLALDDAPPATLTAVVNPQTGVAEVVPQAQDATETGIDLASLVYGVIIGILGGGGALAILTRIGNDKMALDAGEKLFLSFPPETRDVIVSLVTTLDKLTDIAVKITDGQPNTVTVPPSSARPPQLE